MANVAERADRLDCPECGAAGAVRRGLCDVCYAEIDECEDPVRAAALPPAAGRPPAAPSAASPTDPLPAGVLRFADVLGELRTIAAMGDPDDPSAADLIAACRRVEALLESLRVQFLRDLGLSGPPAAPALPA